MSEAIRVRLIAETRIEDTAGETQSIRHAGYGTLFIEGDRFALSYEDHQENEWIEVVLKGNTDKIEIHRSGDAKGVLVFIPGQETKSVYYLGYGEIDISIRTVSIDLQLNETSGSIMLLYESRISGESVNRTQYVCRWKS